MRKIYYFRGCLGYYCMLYVGVLDVISSYYFWVIIEWVVRYNVGCEIVCGVSF